MNRGTLFLLGGMNDIWIVGVAWRKWLPTARLPHRIDLTRWQQGLGAVFTFADLWRTKHHRHIAATLAEKIRANQTQFPGEPIHILAHSAGTAIATYCLESLTPQESITSAVFVGSGLSSNYDLSNALHRTRVGILSVESYLDWFFLGIGTSLLGSADRHWGPAAGMIGFRNPSDPSVAGKLKKLRWTPALIREGWIGGHVTIASPWFIRGTLATWIRQAEAVEGGEVVVDGKGFWAKTNS